MLTKLFQPERTATNERGQILIIFAFAFVAIIIMLTLLFDGARGLVMRRELRNASDAAAMAGANILESIFPTGCSATVDADGTPGDEQAAVKAAVETSISANLPNYPLTDIDIRCPAGQGNSVVEVRLNDQSPTFFGQFIGHDALDVGARSQAINGQNAGNQYSVILLDPSHLNWQQGHRGCPSFLLSGGPTVIFDSSIYIDSECTEANGGAMSTNGNATTLQLGEDGPKIRIVGEYNQQALTITPAPVEGADPKADPLQYLDLPPYNPCNALGPPPWPASYVPDLPPGYCDTPTKFTSASSLKVRATTKTIVGQGQSSSSVVLHPGVYKGGIELRNSSVALLEPGIYVIQGGGLKLGAQSSMFAVNYQNGVYTYPAKWGTGAPDDSCLDDQCGVMIFNTGDQSGSLAMGAIDISAGATFKVRSYESGANSPSSIRNNVVGNGCCSGTPYSHPAFDHMLFWQPKNPAASANYAQPVIHLNGGGNVFMSGTIYAPQAKVLMGGGSGGSGGSNITLTLQFIVWDLEISGNATFHFVYDGDEFVTPPDYGLIL
jgi:hypothetical protein